MQPNEITLAVDTENTGTTTNRLYSRFEEYLNRSVYVGPTHSILSKDQMAMYRTFPKPSGNFLGVGKSAVKFTQDFTVVAADGVSSVTSPVILEMSFSVPVGVTAAQLVEIRQRALALLDTDTIMDPLNLTLMV